MLNRFAEPIYPMHLSGQEVFPNLSLLIKIDGVLENKSLTCRHHR